MTQGFTLVELIVSLSITAIIMVGLSMFFASSFQNVFQAQQKLEGTQGHFVINDIIQDKFANLEKVPVQNSDNVIIQNKIAENTLPFTYIGLDSAKLVFKDFFMFKGMYGVTASSASGIPNAAGITKIDSGDYYIVAPLENKIYKCKSTGITDCEDFITSELKQPIGITTDGTDLYVADSGNNKIVKINVTTKGSTLVAENLNFPVGIDYYNDGTNGYLFFSEPYKNKVYRVKTDGTDLKVVVGDGDDEVCDDSDGFNHSALYCKLDFPTGVFADDTGTPPSLYIADTGSGRVLKVSDPGAPANLDSPARERIPFEFGDNYSIGKIVFENFDHETFHESNMVGTPSTLNGSYDSAEHKLTLNSIFNTYNGPCTWDTSGSEIITDTDPNTFLHANDYVAIENGSSGDAVLYKVTSVPIDKTTICLIGVAPSVVANKAYRIPIDTNLTGVSNDKPVYMAGKKESEETIDLIFASNSFTGSGFQKIDIKVYDFDQTTLLESYSHNVRIGNGILGTPEDKIEVLGTYTYPTGVTNLGTGDEITFNPASATFDYTTDFTIDSLAFSKPNGGAILQAIIQAGGKDYIINGALP
jgi:prepilin-type N-terminal cleavage/methylation domain-containing protein